MTDSERIDNLEIEVKELHNQQAILCNKQDVQGANVEHIFTMIGEIKSCLGRIETAIYTKEDPFRKAMFSVGIWAIKVLVGGGALVFLISQFPK